PREPEVEPLKPARAAAAPAANATVSTEAAATLRMDRR
ncbi:MAG: hypothetical protein QOD35_1707, partial [Nocardioidaceae bacterium]|nr:hypothetical protein [Nocardioidaceae bacterium]